MLRGRRLTAVICDGKAPWRVRSTMTCNVRNVLTADVLLARMAKVSCVQGSGVDHM